MIDFLLCVEFFCQKLRNFFFFKIILCFFKKFKQQTHKNSLKSSKTRFGSVRFGSSSRFKTRLVRVRDSETRLESSSRKSCSDPCLRLGAGSLLGRQQLKDYENNIFTALIPHDKYYINVLHILNNSLLPLVVGLFRATAPRIGEILQLCPLSPIVTLKTIDTCCSTRVALPSPIIRERDFVTKSLL